MKTEHDGIRKAAIVIANLDPQAAARVLQRFAAAEADELRQAVRDLGDIDAREQRRVLDEFLRQGPRAAQQPAGIELDDRLAARRFAPQSVAADEVLLSDDEGGQRPFGFLHEAEAEKLVRALSGERPQTIALVLAHLPSDQSGTILVRFEPALQVEIIRRLIELEETDPAILREVERALESRLSQQVNIQRRRVAGLKAVAGILRSSARPIGAEILRNVAAHDRGLAEKLGPEPVAFEDLLDINESAWGAIVDHADRELLALALLGAPQMMVGQVTAQLSTAAAQVLEQQLDNPGPIRLRDVEQARHELAELARRLAFEGRIQIPRRRQTTISAAA